MLMPKRTKYRRPHRVSYEGKAKGAKELNFGDYGIMALEGCWLTQQQIESSRIAITHYMGREGHIWIRVFPHMILTKKPLAVRMGGGKGSPEGYVAVVKRGTVLFEMSGITEEDAREAVRLASHKLPVKTKFVKKVAGE